MAKTKFTLLEVGAFGRRRFISAGGAIALSVALGGCDDNPGQPLSSRADAGQGVTAAPGDQQRAEDAINAAAGVENGDACEDWRPDSTDGGADMRPYESQPPPGEWGEVVPPISSNADFYVTCYFGIANVDICNWTLEFAIRGQAAVELNAERMYALQGRQKEHTLQCIESRPTLMKMDNAVWTGLPLREVLDALGVTLDEGLTGIRFLCADTYEVGLPIEELDIPIWLCWEMNGERLPPEHGFPARMICPGRYGWQNAKQLVAIDFIEGDPVPEYQKAWDTHYGVQGLVVQPEAVALSNTGETIRILGKAFGGTDPVVWVGISVDGGETYDEAELTYAPGEDRWTCWRYEWTPEQAGNIMLRSRCRTASGLEVETSSGGGYPFIGTMAIYLKVS